MTWVGKTNVRMLSSTLDGLACTYTSPTVAGQANNGICQFIGAQ
ncbi:MAG: hypothetical protein PHC75_04375 [Burkholderiales bacterium]|nr:hypothetical protein [Burkholderiales bacterium]